MAPSLVVGTAGHIDHGKTALARALTGVDTDRLPEEKARGISIELGFAELDLGDGVRASLVDVPGHERFVRTMAAGSHAVDVALLVVAADDGVMPQTREHLAVCELLGVRHAVVALSRIDLVEDDMRALAEEDVRELLAGSAFAGAPVLPVCAPRGDGVEALRAALREAGLRTLVARPRREAEPARLAIDRGFSVRGFGAVVTGTLRGRGFAVGDEVVVLPDGRRARVRGLERHGRAERRLCGGVRCAVNLQGVELSELARGDWLAEPEGIQCTDVFDAELAWLSHAPDGRERAAVELLLGGARRRARVLPIGADALQAGGSGFARIHLESGERPVPALPGERFVVRGFARDRRDGATWGGGRVLDLLPAHRRRRDPLLQRELRLLAGDRLTDMLRVRLGRAGLAGAATDALRLACAAGSDAVEKALGELAAAGDAHRLGSARWIADDARRRVQALLCERLRRYHTEHPLRPGMPTASLRAAVPDNVPPRVAEAVLQSLAETGLLEVLGERVRLAGFEASPDARGTELAERIVQSARSAGLEPPGLRDWLAQLEIGEQELRELLAHLEREGRLVHAPGDLWFDADAVESLRQRLMSHLAHEPTLTTQAYKQLIGVPRRTAVPLMELFDEWRLTRRDGDVRVAGPALRAGAEARAARPS